MKQTNIPLLSAAELHPPEHPLLQISSRLTSSLLKLRPTSHGASRGAQRESHNAFFLFSPPTTCATTVAAKPSPRKHHLPSLQQNHHHHQHSVSLIDATQHAAHGPLTQTGEPP
ncbi:hypothetical protein PLESTF_000905800 [Pleodorina starrii]|nr:hypothetical protein PLESTF_000905800 [Pleodorina starrii]